MAWSWLLGWSCEGHSWSEIWTFGQLVNKLYTSNVGSRSRASFRMYFISYTVFRFKTIETIGCQPCRGVSLRSKERSLKAHGHLTIFWHRLIASYYIHITKLEIVSLAFRCKNCVPKSPQVNFCFLFKYLFLQHNSMGFKLTSSNTGPKAEQSGHRLLGEWWSHLVGWCKLHCARDMQWGTCRPLWHAAWRCEEGWKWWEVGGKEVGNWQPSWLGVSSPNWQVRYSIARHYMSLLTIFLCHLSSMMFYLRSFLVVSSGIALRNSWWILVMGSCNPTYN